MATQATARPHSRGRLRRSAQPRRGPGHSQWPGVLFVAPATIGFAVFVLLPLALTVYYSFTSYDLFSPPQSAGLGNYRHLVGDARLRQTYINTAIFCVLAVPLNVGLALLLAVGLNRKMSGWLRVTIRSAFFFPSLVGLIFVAIVWQFFFQTDDGIFNYYLGLAGIGPVYWLSSPAWALPSIVILDVWKNVGLAMLILLAGLQGIPKVYYEAASLDGASAWRQFRSVTIPLLSPQIFFVTTLYLIGALKVFDSIVVLTNGGPGDSSRSVVMYIYEKAFQSFNFGYAAAVSVSLLVVIGIVTALQFWASRKWVHYE
ncbi:ABC transporter permease subunit [Streptomyces sp. SID8361]|uniref:carbohydrate ABC transporter permease n=1 Tax=Streptomyces TaxID=1883 RepID=UPI00081D8A6D|nr:MULTISPECIES: sugar ABC transporter permease [unclassified Streptomyces]AUA17210.1 Lactose transport system permease protein LacF [Streptomyces sp. M56]MYU14506.1 ABC transporter permease subunit [Streptomyces sp. SID8361]MYX63449.1 ABC transporter permease subunit [Streptomyces sp. SID8382]SCG06223.1 carbohydrate ABC transporter membrane protein 1, CUT1 family [Streptomyces sp. MnatMP-M27]